MSLTGSLRKVRNQATIRHYHVLKTKMQCRRRCVQVSPAREDTVFQACGLTAKPAALVAGSTAAGQRGTRRREWSDQQAAQGSFRDRHKR